MKKNNYLMLFVCSCICILFIIATIVSLESGNFIFDDNLKSKNQNYYCAYCGKELRIGGMPPQGTNFVCSDMCLALSKVYIGPYDHHVDGVVNRYEESDWFNTAFAFYPESTDNKMCIDAHPFQVLLSLNKIRTMFSNNSVFTNGKMLTLESYVTGQISFICGTDNNGKYLEFVGDNNFKIYENEILEVLKTAVVPYNNIMKNNAFSRNSSSGGFGSSHHSRMSQSISRRSVGLPW